MLPEIPSVVVFASFHSINALTMADMELLTQVRLGSDVENRLLGAKEGKLELAPAHHCVCFCHQVVYHLRKVINIY